ncbi:hypothetical protein LINPERPRIM_LOCUS20631 [Linum perenne]
MSPPPAD